MKKLLSIVVLLLCAFFTNAQVTTTINFDTTGNWITGSGSLTSYRSNHTYTEGLFSASTDFDALRQTSTTQDGFAGANGIFAWRLRNSGTGAWTASIASGGVSTFNVNIRRWDAAPDPNYTLDYSIDGGATWINVSTINNATLSNSSAYTTYGGTINSANATILIRVNRVGGERIMIDDFVWTDFQAVLPVHYSRLAAYKSGIATVIDWQTSTENNCKRFNILHSTDGSYFKQIGSIDSKAGFGNSTAKLDYKFFDSESRIGTNYYRLEQVDIDGTSSHSELIKVIWTESRNISMYPNPVIDELHIDLSTVNPTQMELKIVDMSGVTIEGFLLKTESGLNHIRFNLAHLPTGVYGVQVLQNNVFNKAYMIRKN